jgi:tartrate-resistant acid phosphatase type 5
LRRRFSALGFLMFSLAVALAGLAGLAGLSGVTRDRQPGLRAAFGGATPADAATLAVIGDFGACADDRCADEGGVADLVASWRPNAVITVGDNNYPNGSTATLDRNIRSFYGAFLEPRTTPGGALRFIPTLGNHDWDCAGCPAPYLGLFELPGNERYYETVATPNLTVYVLDSDDREPDGIGVDSVQATWLRDALARSTTPWNIVVMHHPPHNSGNHGPTLALRWPFQEWGADAVLAGHAHDFERLQVDGIPYLVVGTGGADLKSFGHLDPASQVRVAGRLGAERLIVSPSVLILEFWSVEGVVLDRVTLP